MFPEKLRNQVLNCDCLKGMQELPDACIPLTVTSPPYDNLRLYGGGLVANSAIPWKTYLGVLGVKSVISLL